MKNLLSASILAATVAIAGACSSSTTPAPSSSNDAGADGADPIVEGTDGAPAPAKTYEVEVNDFAFTPKKLTIKVGETVEWKFTEGTHSVTSGKSCTSDARFDSGEKDSPSTFRRTFDSAGTFDYYCAVRSHCAMGQVGVVEVQP